MNSDVFARDSAEVMRGLGLDVTLLPSALPTPVLAFAVRHLGVGAGVMVTASHNPPRDNGYKVYLGGDDDGSQIVPPVDATIAAAIDAVAATPLGDLPRATDYTVASADLVGAYVSATAAIVPAPALPVGSRSPASSTRPCTASGGTPPAPSSPRPGSPSPRWCPSRSSPTAPSRPSSFPNPEEPGAMDLAIARGVAVGADLVIANDPDADRLALAIPDGSGSYRRLSGNEVGWLLGWRAAQRAVAAGQTGVLAASIVSSPALSRVAERHGLGYRDTLTGFKWVSRVPDLLFGYEEALGYLVDPEVVRDKDGISAALVLLDLATTLAAAGIEHRRAARRVRGGVRRVRVRTGRDPCRRPRPHRHDHAGAPVVAAGDARPVVRAPDDRLRAGVDGFPPSDILRYDLDGEARVIVRPSGTEPKVKVYIDTVAATPAQAQSLVEALADAIRPRVS